MTLPVWSQRQQGGWAKQKVLIRLWQFVLVGDDGRMPYSTTNIGPSRFGAVSSDVSDRSSAVLQASGEAVIVVSTDHRIVFFNCAAERMFGWTASDVVGEPLDLLLPEDARTVHRDYINDFAGSAAMARPMAQRRSVAGRRANGAAFPCEVTIGKIAVAGSMEFVAFLTDLTDRDSMLADLTRRADTDALSGLANRHVFNEALADLVSRAQNQGTPLTLVMFDLDRFKRVNDTYGHDVGDAVIQCFAGVLGSHVRGTDLAVRYGGEEFALLLPGSPLAQAREVAERVRAAMAEARIPTRDGTSISVTVSAGLATWQVDDETPHELLKRSDQALYAAKADGRNRVVTQCV
ncbi:GGDEF domain-containing protein [Rhodothalassium salexigens]|nr:sensor domain-containing diguanylate cyclase [Rhodothalassium salexigens]